MHHSSIYLFISAGVVEWLPWCFTAFLLHQAPVEMPSVLVLFVIFEGSIQLIGS